MEKFKNNEKIWFLFYDFKVLLLLLLLFLILFVKSIKIMWVLRKKGANLMNILRKR